jgi:predicted TIM-barrel fold metal-dependent hydrolase
MEPMCVDTIARAFPDLNCIMAHFGSTGRRDVSEGIVKWNANVYGDLTSFSSAYEIEPDGGWRIEAKYLEEYVSILRPLHAGRLAHKLLFGTDTEISRPDRLAAKKASHKAVYDGLGIGEADQRAIFRDTAVRLLGLD